MLLSSRAVSHSPYHLPQLQAFLADNYARLHRRLTRHLRCPDLASDSLHDTWLRLGEREFAGEARNPEALVYRVACNLALDRLRADRPWQYLGGIDTELDQIVDPSPGPAAIAELRSEIAAVDRAMDRLPRRHRAVLLALRMEEMARQDVAQCYDMSLRSVDTALRQALDACAEHTGRKTQGGVSSTRRALRPRQASR